MSGPQDNALYERQPSLLKRILGTLAMAGILIMLILLGISLAILVASPYYVAKDAGSAAATNCNVTVEFSRYMNSTSCEKAFAMWEGDDAGPRVNGTFSWPYKNLLIFTPSKPLKPGTWHVVWLKNAATDLKGNKLASDPWEFKTGNGPGAAAKVRAPADPTEIENAASPEIRARSPVTLRGGFYVAVPWIVSLGAIEGSALVAWDIVLVLSILGCFAYLLWKEGAVTVRILSHSLRRFKAPPEDTNNSLVILIQVFLAILAFELTYILIYQSFVPSLEAPDFNYPAGTVLYILANASVWEEIIVRILLFGVPLAIVYAASGRKALPGLLGGSRRWGGPEFFLIFFSSAIFSVAHWLGGWGMWKVFPTFVAGLAFGYIFVRIGIHGAIIFHFLNDYLMIPAMLTDSISIAVGFALIQLFFLFVGVSYFFYYIRKFAGFIGRKSGLLPQPLPDDGPAPPAGYPQGPQQAGGYARTELPTFPGPAEFGYRCGSCGWMEAKYMGNGAFQCLRCGAVSGGSREAAARSSAGKAPALELLRPAGSPGPAGPSVTITVTVGADPASRNRDGEKDSKEA